MSTGYDPVKDGYPEVKDQLDLPLEPNEPATAPEEKEVPKGDEFLGLLFLLFIGALVSPRS